MCALLESNLERLRVSQPELAQRIADATPADLTWQEAKTGLLTASIPMPEGNGKMLQLASRYDPAKESEQLLKSVDLTKHGGIALIGLGLGYTMLDLVKRIGTKQQTVVIVFEPDAGMLRAVFERIDHTSWLGNSLYILADREVDRAELLSRVEPWNSHITQGMVLVNHPPTQRCDGQACQTFGAMVAELLAFARTHVATALVNSARTYANLTINAPRFAAGANTNDLHGAAKGCPAVCVGAGPSLAKNIDLLRDPAVRRNVIVITAQTTLKPLLQRGIRPDFVTALDYSEISSRFYEDLPALPDVTLVAQPLAHPSILDKFPGPIRVTNSIYLQDVMGEDGPDIIPIPYGATVAHLSFYLAQHLGCAPIILTGQDLAFSDGLYYCPGTAIHDVWANELNPFNTVEMMEWQRIVRHRVHLQRHEDIHGRPVFSDEQMMTYLKQFERDFATAEAKGQPVLDATEGGLSKAHTTQITLAEALAKHATQPAPQLPMPEMALDRQRLQMTRDRLKQLRDDSEALRLVAVRTVPILEKMLKSQRDKKAMEKLFDKLRVQQKEVTRHQHCYDLINQLNCLGTFRRARADRAIQHQTGDQYERQAAQLQRDLDNVQIMEQAAIEALGIFDKSIAKTDGFLSGDPATGANNKREVGVGSAEIVVGVGKKAGEVGEGKRKKVPA